MVDAQRSLGSLEADLWTPCPATSPSASSGWAGSSPATGKRCWFNQIAFLSEWTLAPELREPFEGPREVVVALSGAVHVGD